MRKFKTDLHIHTCLSPCADLEMSPKNIIKEAKKKGLHIIGICDHNSAENVPAVKKSAEKEEIKVIGGIEVTSKEEVHILALFEKDERLFSLQEIIYENLQGTNDESLYGEQIVANEEDEVVGFNKKLLIGATEISVKDVVDLTHKLNGLAIASHVDREGFGIIGQLGFIPDGLALDALEIMDPSKKHKIPGKQGFSFITSSDAHSLEEIGKRYTCFFMQEVNMAEMRKSLFGEDGREVRI